MQFCLCVAFLFLLAPIGSMLLQLCNRWRVPVSKVFVLMLVTMAMLLAQAMTEAGWAAHHKLA